MIMNPGLRILMENALTYKERGEITSLMENELSAVNNVMIANLYKSAIEKSHIDFDTIPDSKGDLTRYTAYKSIMEVIQLLNSLCEKNGAKIHELDVVETAINNIIANRISFEKGFQLNKEFIILQYNTLVYAVVVAVSEIVSSYVDFVKRPDQAQFTILKGSRRSGTLCISNLEKFNASVKSGDFTKVLGSVIDSGRENFVGSAAVVPLIIVGSVLVLVPAMRELIFMFYYSRMRVSDYLAQQAALLEINKQNVQINSRIPTKEKNEILRKQQETISKLHNASDKIRVNRVVSEGQANGELQRQNKSFTISSVTTQAASSDQNGIQLL